MNAKQVASSLKQQFPGKKIILLPEDNPTEILCEIEPTHENPQKSEAISVIDRSVPHYHQKMTEVYQVLKGDLTVYINGEKHELIEGDTLTIAPGQIHYAVGNETWIKCTATPGWTPEDHILAETNQRRE